MELSAHPWDIECPCSWNWLDDANNFSGACSVNFPWNVWELAFFKNLCWMLTYIFNTFTLVFTFLHYPWFPFILSPVVSAGPDSGNKCFNLLSPFPTSECWGLCWVATNCITRNISSITVSVLLAAQDKLTRMLASFTRPYEQRLSSQR